MKLKSKILLIVSMSVIICLSQVANAVSSKKDYMFDCNTGTIIKYIGFDSDVEIPSSIDGVYVKNIGPFAFTEIDNSYYKKLNSVIIPYGVTNIDLSAFSDCWNLKKISMPNSVTKIGSNAFSNCWSLKSINIPNSVTSIDGWMFDYKGISKIEVLVDDKIVGTAVYGYSRPDILELNPLYKTANVGFRYVLDTKSIKNGYYTIKVKATIKNGNTSILQKNNVCILN